MNNTVTCSANWDNGAVTDGTLTSGVCTASHQYSTAGVYTIQATLADDDTGSDVESVVVVAYDPSAAPLNQLVTSPSPVGVI